jgi:serine/threonine protein kinase
MLEGAMDLRQIGKYEIKRLLGAGAFGETFLAIDTLTKKEVALKKFRNPATGLQALKTELAPLLKLKHHNIIEYKDCNYFVDQDGNQIFYIATEYASQGTLTRFKGVLQPNQVIEYCLQILEGLQECHKHGIIHRDLKPDNIFLKDDTIKIGDFGISIEGTEVGDVIGTKAYMAPEQFLDGKSSRRTDIWSVGVILYEMIYGKMPFHSVGEIINRKHGIDIPTLSEIQGLRDVIQKALSKSESTRYQTCEEFIQAIQEAASYNRSPSSEKVTAIEMKPTRIVISLSDLENTMSNPHYERDIKLLDWNWDLSKVIGKDTIIIATGCNVNAELLDRPVAEILRDAIDKRGMLSLNRRAIVIGDLWWLREASLQSQPTIAIGGPATNFLTQDFAAKGKKLEARGHFQAHLAAPYLRVALWGKGSAETRTCVEDFIVQREGLTAFLAGCWK